MIENIYEKYNIDKSKLKRDYILNPLQKDSNNRFIEIPFKEDIEYLYNELGLPQSVINEYFNIPNRDPFCRWLKKYNIHRNKDIAQKLRVQTFKKKFGVENLHQYEEFKNKATETIKRKYGVDNVSKSDIIKKKKQETTNKNYGVDNPFQSDVIKEQMKQTSISKYGTEYPSQNDIVKEKIKQSGIEKYGVPYHTQQHMSLEALDILTNKDLLVKFIKDNNILNGTDLGNYLDITKSTSNKYLRNLDIIGLFDYNGSIPEQELREYVNLYYKTENNTRKYLDGQEIDIYIPKLNVGIEFNGSYWHNEFNKEKKYHQEKSKLAEERGIFLYHIFEYEWKNNRIKIFNQLNNILKLNYTKYYARDCILKEVSNNDKKNFLQHNHLQCDDTSSVRLGLYCDDKLVSIMTFCKPRFNKKYEWELSRFCSLVNCNVVGGASKLFKFFIDNYNPKSIISYSNIAHTRGNLYQMLGFELNSISNPNYVWCKNGNKILSRYQCQKHKLIEQGFEGNSESEIMYSRGFYKIYDCGNKVWLWLKK